MTRGGEGRRGKASGGVIFCEWAGRNHLVSYSAPLVSTGHSSCSTSLYSCLVVLLGQPHLLGRESAHVLTPKTQRPTIRLPTPRPPSSPTPPTPPSRRRHGPGRQSLPLRRQRQGHILSTGSSSLRGGVIKDRVAGSGSTLPVRPPARARSHRCRQPTTVPTVWATPAKKPRRGRTAVSTRP